MISEELTPTDIQIILRSLGIDTKGKGWQTINSPLREEKNASFGMNMETGGWKDHTTGETGDIVTLIECIHNVDTKGAINWIKDKVDISGALYSPPVNGKVKKKDDTEPFWNADRKEFIRKGIKRLKSEPGHELVKIAKEYDCLKSETLQKYGCGIVEMWHSKWLAFPYSTGCQLYRRDGEKVIRSVKNSSPGDTFFGIKQTMQKKLLFIAKSPRECMLINQIYGSTADVIGLASGEQGTISKKQFEALRNEIYASNYGRIFTFLDCDTKMSLDIAKNFVSELKKAAENENVKLVNVHKSTGHKDVTDCIRAGMNEDIISTLIEAAEILDQPEKPTTEKEDESEFKATKPWDDPVDGVQVSKEIRAVLHKYMVLPEHSDIAITLWILFSYVYDEFDCCPILAIASPEKRCGKTTLLALLTSLCQKPLSASNITPAATYRAIEKWKPTLLVDEADTFLKQQEELRGILNSGHTRPTAFVTRAVSRGKDFDVQRFSTWAPKAIAMIGKLPDTLADRSIMVKMRRKRADEFRDRVRYSKLHNELEDLRRKIARWAVDVQFSNVEPPKQLDDRAADNWMPLLAIAKDVGINAIDAALGLSGKTDTDTIRTELLIDIHTILQADGSREAIPSKDLLRKLNEMEERPWANYHHGKELTGRGLAALLKPFGIGSDLIRFGETVARGYQKVDFLDAFSRYTPNLSVTNVTTLSTNDLQGNLSVTTNNDVTDKKDCKPLQHNDVTDVTDKNRGVGTQEDFYSSIPDTAPF